MPASPKVFISYSWKSEEYKEFVLQLATRLRQDGVDVILDRFDLRPGHDTNAFMLDSIQKADKILIFCEENYVAKANAYQGGAGIETRIITPKVLKKSQQEKVIPVYLESHKTVPDYLSDRLGIDYQNRSEEEYRILVKTLFGIPEVARPKLGSPPAWLEDRETKTGKKKGRLLIMLLSVIFVLVVVVLYTLLWRNVETTPTITGDGFIVNNIISFTPTPTPAPTPTQAEYFDVADNSDGSVTITGYSGSDTAIVIPETINGMAVKAIGSRAFENCKTLTSVSIPSSVTVIGNSAFYGCTGLTSVNIPNSVTEIEGYAFHLCIGLTSVNIPSSITEIRDGAFYGCTGLTSVSIPNSVTAIGNGAFSRCTGLTSVSIPDSVTAIGNSAFSGCTGLTSVSIPGSVTKIGSWAFYGCTKLTDIYYSGSESQWSAIDIDKDGNKPLTSATIHYNYNSPAH